MAVNLDKTSRWKADIALSVDMYNAWFMEFAPAAFRNTRLKTTIDVETALKATQNLTNVKPALLRKHPEILPTLRMSTCPPIAMDRLIGLAGVSPSLVRTMELDHRLPPRMNAAKAGIYLEKIGTSSRSLSIPTSLSGLDAKPQRLKSRFTEPPPSSRTGYAVLLPTRSSGTHRKSVSLRQSRLGLKRVATRN